MHSRHIRHSRHRRHQRHSGTPVPPVSPLVIQTNLPATKSIEVDDSLTLNVSVSGGVQPYQYVWEKDSVVVAGQTTATLNKANAQIADSGVYNCTITDDEGNSIISDDCTVTVV